MSATEADPVPRHLDVFEAARQQRVVVGRLAVASLGRLRSSLATAEGTIDFRYAGAVDARGRPAARLGFSGTVDLVCDRCNGPLAVALQGEARYFFVRGEDELARIPVDDTEEEPLLGSSQFDLFELIEDEVILALPISPRHGDCRPPAAAADVSSATEEAAPMRRPFAALAQLKPRRQ